jgi:hypothetical protein
MRSSHRSKRSSRRSFLVSSPSHQANQVIAWGALATSVACAFPHTAYADEAARDATPSSLAPAAGEPPRVSIAQPAYSDLVKGNTPIVIAVTPGSAPTKTIELLVDGVTASDGPQALPNVPSAQFNWDTTRKDSKGRLLFKDGLHRLTVRVTDEKGARGEAETQVYINNSRIPDAKAPSLQWMNIQSGDLLHGQVDFHLKASDNFGVKFVAITVNPVDAPDRRPSMRASLINRAPYVYKLDTTRLPDGVYVLSARALDMLQNEGEAQRITFGVANNGVNPTVIQQLDAVREAEQAKAPAKSGERLVKNTVPTKATTNASTRREAAMSGRARPSVAPPRVQSLSAPQITPPKVTAPQKTLVIKSPVATARIPKISHVAPSIAKTPEPKRQRPRVPLRKRLVRRLLLKLRLLHWRKLPPPAFRV